MPPIHHVSIGFLPEGFHPLHRFLSLSNRPECPTSKLDRVLKASAILRHSVPCHDCQFRIINLSEVMSGGRNQRNWHGAAAAELGQGRLRAVGNVPPRSLPHRSDQGHRVVSSGRGRVPPGKFSGLWPFTPGDHRVRAQVRVICSAASSGGQGRVVRHHYGVGIAVWAWSCSCRRHGC
jgi:hypothetical protein